MKLSKTLAAVFAALMPLTGYAYGQSPVSTERVKIVLGSLPLAPTWGVTIVTRAELWKKYLPNVEVERVEAMSGMPLVNNIIAGKIDIAYMGDTPSLILGSRHDVAESKFVAVTEADQGGSAAVFIKNDAPFKSIADLDKKKVSISFGAYTHRFAEQLADSNKLKFEYVGQSPEVGVSSLQAGRVDALITWPPYGELAVHRGFGRVLMDGSGMKFNSARCVVVSKDFAEKHPDILIGWLRAELDAHRLLRERPNYAAQLIFEDWKKYDVPLEVIKEGFKYKVYPDDIAPEWRKVMTDSADFLLKQGLVKQSPNFGTFIDDSYLKKAAAIPSQLDLSKYPQ
ncbi:MAG TPA: glycine betaine ABC transporter substrate-binding protein [Xanthobacteraceae bacterium]|nr:glycine betaine ABC transporter substrate-binding protein [Xanthobacteraceae bacterium]